MSKSVRSGLVCVAFASAMIAASVPTEVHAAPPPAAGDAVQVDKLSFPVRLSDGHDYQITGYYHHRGAPSERVLQVLVHGATHYHLYWDLPEINGISYSYANYMAEHDYDVLAIDQLGTGESSQPDGDFVTLPETASALHQVLASLRTPNNPTRRLHQRIALVGHSNGSLTSVFTTGTYHDPDVLVTTAFMHAPHPLPFNPADILAVLTTPYIPATTFSKAFWIGVFYHVPQMDPQLVDYEYAHLGPAVQARAQFLDLFLYGLNSSLTRSTQVNVPVLVQNGDFDALQPAAFMGPEPTFYPNAPSVTVNALSEIGHHINGHRNHMQSWTQIDSFIRSKLTRGSGHGN